MTVTVHLASTEGDAADALLCLVEQVTGTRPARLTHACPQCGSDQHGRPVVVSAAGVHVSLSRPRDAGPALVAVCLEAAVGVDVEAAGASVFEGFDEVTLHPDEHCPDDASRLRTWVRKEALLKSHGVGLATDPRTVRLSDDGSILEGPPGTIVDVELDGQMAAVAITPPARVSVVWHQPWEERTQ